MDEYDYKPDTYSDQYNLDADQEQQSTTNAENVAVEDVKVNVDEAQVQQEDTDKEETSGKQEEEDAKSTDEDEDLTSDMLLEEYYPWLIASGIGFLLLIIAVALLATSGGFSSVFPYAPQYFTVPTLQGSFLIYSVDGKKLRFSNDMRYIGSKTSLKYRYKIEPLLKYVYTNASLDVEAVVILSFKYGGAAKNPIHDHIARSPLTRSATDKKKDGRKRALLVRHWVYLKENLTLSMDEVVEKVKEAIDAVPNIEIDKSSVKLVSLDNMTELETIKALTQAGFFKHGLKGLDFSLLELFGITGPAVFGIQSEDDGPCIGLSTPENGNVQPYTCTDSVNTHIGMACQFSCNNGYDMIGSRTRVCLSSGLWSGQPAHCKPKCKPLKPLSEGVIRPPVCTIGNSTMGQMCFLRCPSETHKMVFPSDTSELIKSAESNLWPTINEEMRNIKQIDSFSNVRGYFRECGEFGDWTGSDASCKAICPRIEAPSYGKVTPEHCQADPVEGEVCMITCDPGYGLIGGGDMQLLTCDVSGRWTKEIPVCKKLCPALSETSHRKIEPLPCLSAPYEGYSCTYSCDEGYLLSGDQERTCTDGEWDVSEPECVPACDPISNPQNGLLNSPHGPCNQEKLPEGTICTTVCDFGYQASVNSTQCQSSRTWATPVVTCYRVCPALTVEVDGAWSPATCYSGEHQSMLGTCDLSCHAGHSEIGSSSLTCQENGRWDNTQGYCTATCAGLSSPTNGAVESKTLCNDGTATVNTTCRFSCDADFELVGERTLICGSNGLWSNSVPTCNAKAQYMIAQFIVDHHICLGVDDDGNLRKWDMNANDCDVERARWQLKDQYSLQNALSGSCISQSNESSLFTMADCDIVSADQVFKSGYDYILKLSDTDQFVTSGYRTIEAPQVVEHVDMSDPNLVWRFYAAADASTMNTPLSFHGIQNSGGCLPLDLNSNIDVTVSCLSGVQAASTSCSLSCSGGHTLSPSGFDTVTCTNGAWEIPLNIHCSPDSTPVPSGCPSLFVDLVWGVVVQPSSCSSGSVTVGSSCTLTCSDGTNMYIDGPTRVTCQEDGRWSSYEPSVCRNRCPRHYPLPEDSHLVAANGRHCTGSGSGTAIGGTVCPFSCDEGFQLVGSAMLTCGYDGKWSHPMPQCVKTCPNLEQIPNASLMDCQASESGLYLAGTTCNFECDIGYHAQTTSPSITCQSSGSWLVEGMGELECLPKCPDIEMNSHMNVVPLNCALSIPVYGMACTFSCEDGYGLDLAEDNLQFSDAVRLSETWDLGYSEVVRTCGENGMWSGSVVACTKRCPPLPKIRKESSGYYNPSSCNKQVNFRPGTKCQLLCQGADSVYSGLDTATCGDDGLWTPAEGLGLCVPACNALPVPEYAMVTPLSCVEGFVKAGTECVIACPQHMERMGPGFHACLGYTDAITGSRWSGAGPTTCVARCPPLSPLPGTYVSPKNCATSNKVEGELCSFECDDDYSLAGSSALQCTESGIWHAPLPTCYRPCPILDLAHGLINCVDTIGFPIDGAGYTYGPGTKCVYTCDQGFTAYAENEITCNKNGIWNPTPFCTSIIDAFPIIQTIDEKSVCLQAVRVVDGGEGSEWRVVTTNNSTDGCLKAGNNAMWFWSGSSNLKHAETGLCLAAESAFPDAAVHLQRCDLMNPLQHWSCDAQYPYRFILEATSLSIDTVYKELGPVLQSWTHAETYWITFNPTLETTGTVCSNKAVGSCPPIKVPRFNVFPEICMSDEVEIWQRCSVSCGDGITFSGPTDITECQPTGEWKDIEFMHCFSTCPARSPVMNGQYENENCTKEGNIHNTVCKLVCDDGRMLSNGKESASYTCSDGKWVGEENLACKEQCLTQPAVLNHGQVKCGNVDCTITCDTGYWLEGNSTFPCSAGADYIDVNNISCEEEFHFHIQAQYSIFSGTELICIVASEVDGEPVVRKLECDLTSKNHFWRWYVSDDPSVDFSLLQNVGTGKCLSATSTTSWAELQLSTCNKISDLQQWICSQHLHPGRFGLVSNPNSFVDIGSINLNTPPVVLNEEISLQSSNWLSVDKDGTASYTCSSRTLGACPRISANSFTTVSPTGCLVWINLPVGTECRMYCEDSGYVLQNGQSSNTITCEESGDWSSSVLNCVATSESKGTCSPVTLTEGLMVSPDECGHSDSSHKMLSGEDCSFKCAQGYYLEGKEIIHCKGDDKYDYDVPSCRAICPGHTTREGVVVDPPVCQSIQVPSDTLCTKSCADGYASISSSVEVQSTCNSDGTWSVDYFSCEVACPPLSSTPHNATSNMVEYEDWNRRSLTSSSCSNNWSRVKTVCSFTCPDGNITVDGSDKVKCGGDGKWIGRVPRCVSDFHCPEIISSATVTVSYDPLLGGKAVVPGTAMKIHCAEGYMPDGDDVRMCEQDGTWGGDGPIIPSCTKKCSPLVAPFGGELDPSRCRISYNDDGQACSYTCMSGTKMAGDIDLLSVTCNNNTWSEKAPLCLPDETEPVGLEKLNVFSETSEFLLITRVPDLGCFYAGDDSAVRWRPVEECDPRENANRWQWFDSSRIMTLKGNQCMQPYNPNHLNTTLVVGNCNKTDVNQRFGCGYPRSSYQKNVLFSFSDPQWRLVLQIYQGDPGFVVMAKTTASEPGLPRDVFDGIMLYANTDAMNPANTDQVVCSKVCGGDIYHENSYLTRRITSPGFMEDQPYPANSECHWKIHGTNRVIKFSITELDLDEDLPGSDCSTDCVEVYEGDFPGSTVSNRVAVYSGTDILATSPREIKTVSGSLNIVFKSNGKSHGRGFAATYQYDDLVSPRKECGIRGNLYPEMDETEKSADVTILKWPWLVSIREKYPGSAKAYHRCSGALISEDVVVTSAHCARNSNGASNIDIGIGLTVQNDMDERMRNSTNPSPIFHIYHGYDYLSRHGDIALWKLSKPVTKGMYVFPICIPDQGYRIHKPMDKCYSAGWSSVSEGTRLSRITEYKVSMLSGSMCEETLGLGRDSGFACAENINFDSSAKHESIESEPLMCQHNGNWYLSGVRSYTHVGTREIYRLYTELSGLSAWIKHTMSTMHMYYKSQGAHLLVDQATQDGPRSEISSEYDWEPDSDEVQEWLQKH